MTSLLLTKRLKVADPTAMTALATLRDRMGMAESIAGLSRDELFLLKVDLPADAAVRRVTELVRGTNLFLNPNKHSWRIDAGEGAGPDEAAAGGNARAWLLVRGIEPDTSLLESLWRHAGAREITDLRQFQLWRFVAPAGVAPEALLRAAGRAAVVTDRRNGFLVHPAFQEGRLYAAAPNLYDVESLLTETQPEGLPAE